MMVQPGIAPSMNLQQQSLSSSMKNLSMNPGAPGNLAAPSVPSSKSEQNFLNNNNSQAPGMMSNPPMSQMQPKPGNASMAKRPMYPAQNVASPMAQPQFQQQPTQLSQQAQFQQPQLQQQPQGFNNNYTGGQMGPQSPQMPQQQPRGNLQYQNLQQPQQQQPQHYPVGSVVSQGFNRMWGNETVDLMQQRHILPQTKILPPAIKLNHQFHESTNCSNDIFRCTLTKIPESNSLLQKSRLPLGILIHPYRDLSVSLTDFDY